MLKKRFRERFASALSRNSYIVQNGIIPAFTLSVAVGALSASISGLNKSPLDEINITQEGFIVIAAAAASVSVLFAFVLTYLNRTRNRIRDSVNDLSLSVPTLSLRRMQMEVRKLRDITSAAIDDDGKAKIQKAIEDQIGDVAHAHLINLVSMKVSGEVRSKRYIEIISKSVFRMKSEIESLESRGNLNLSIGIVATVIGIIMLVAFVFTANYEEISIYKFLYHFLPRLSLVIFVQVFAFFFLGLYKANISEIKYYHNELTAVEARVSAVVIAVESGSAECIAKVVSDLSSLDRNATGAGNSELDVERSTETLTKLLSAIAPFVQK